MDLPRLTTYIRALLIDISMQMSLEPSCQTVTTDNSTQQQQALKFAACAFSLRSD